MENIKNTFAIHVHTTIVKILITKLGSNCFYCTKSDQFFVQLKITFIRWLSQNKMV